MGTNCQIIKFACRYLNNSNQLDSGFYYTPQWHDFDHSHVHILHNLITIK